MVAPAVDPSPFAFVIARVPADIVVVPSYVFALDKTKIPDPVLVNP